MHRSQVECAAATRHTREKEPEESEVEVEKMEEAA